MKYRSYLIFTLFILALNYSNAAVADIRLPSVFSEHMVIQQKSTISLWGWADVGEQVSIKTGWNKKQFKAVADKNGRWTMSVKTPGAGGPYTITFQGKNRIELKDILVGEVWFCSGQSNMVFSLKGSEGAKEEIATANYPAIRYFSIKRQYGLNDYEDSNGSLWKITSPETAPGFSALAYYFAKNIHQRLNVPVGIVYAAWGGTPAEAWTDRKTLQSDPILSKYISRWQNIREGASRDSAAYLSKLEDWNKNNQAGTAVSRKPAEPQDLYYFRRPWREPAVLFNGMVEPYTSFPVKGVLWYQGESNVAYSNEYAHLFTSMINGWRSYWKTNSNQSTLPFYFVQLPPHGYSDLTAGAQIREAQEKVSKELKNTGMVVTMDLGDMKDIHPTRKKEVGERLAMLALDKTYREKFSAYAGPVVAKIAMNKGAVELTFSSAVSAPAGKRPGGFELGFPSSDGKDILYEKVAVSIKNNKLIVSDYGSRKPEWIRYGWLEIADANLQGENGLPIAPFSKRID